MSVSKRPHRSPNRKLTDQDRSTILQLRGEGNGARPIQTELRLFGQTEFALATIHKVLTAANVKPLVKPRRSRVPHRYSRPIPGDRVQMDTMKIAPGVYQYTAVDDCSRFRVLGVHPRRNARNTCFSWIVSPKKCHSPSSASRPIAVRNSLRKVCSVD